MIIRALVQARLRSERLPGKVLENIGNLTILEHIATRLRALEPLGVETVFAIAEEDDHRLAEFLSEKDFKYFVGDPQNVLKRFTDAAHDLKDSDFVIRATGDNPFVDQVQLAKIIQRLRIVPFDYGYTADLPLGMGAELIRVNALRSVMMRSYPLRDGEASEILPHHTEHVTTFIRENPHLYDIYSLRLDDAFSAEGSAARVAGIRVTVDEAGDLEVCRRIYTHFERLGQPQFSALDLIQLARNNPEMLAGNAAVKQKPATSYDMRR